MKKTSHPLKSLAILFAIGICVLFVIQINKNDYTEAEKTSEKNQWIKSNLNSKNFSIYFQCAKRNGIEPKMLKTLRKYTELGKKEFYKFNPSSKEGIISSEIIYLMEKDKITVKSVKDNYQNGLQYIYQPETTIDNHQEHEIVKKLFEN